MSKITLYYSDNCIHCKTFMPTWDELKKKIQQKKLKIITEQYEDQEIDHDEINIIGYPTILIEHNGEIYNYEGNRSVDAILQKFNNKDYEALYHKYKKKYLNLKNKK